MTSFNRGTFTQRFEMMGDPAEDAYKQWADANSVSYVPFGLNRPPFSLFYKLPSELRHLPDFLSEALKKNKTPVPDTHFFVEAKGVGTDQVVKIKEEDVAALENTIWFYNIPCYVFVNDIAKNRVGMFDMQYLINDDSTNIKRGQFWDGKKYIGVPTDLDWFLFWHPSPSS